MQETTRQQEYQVKVKEYEAHIEQSKVEQKRIDHEERRKTLIVSRHRPVCRGSGQNVFISNRTNNVGRDETATTTCPISRSIS